MNIICTQENLKNGVLIVGRIISSNNSLPVLNNILLKTENGLLKLSSTNLEIGITTRVRCKIEEPGGVTVVCKTLTELVNNLPNKNINLKTKSGQIELDSDGYKAVVKTTPHEEFPIIPVIEDGKSFEVEAEVLKKALDQVLFAASTNLTQPEISGVLFSLDKQYLKIVATDRYRLAEKKLEINNSNISDAQFIVPHKTLLELSRIIGNNKKAIEVVFNETQAVFKVSDTEIVTRLVDGQYPDYKQIIPTEFNNQIVVKKDELLSALKVASIFSQNSNSVKLVFKGSGGKMVVSTESQELGKSDVEVEARIEGGSGELVLNHRYISECLNNLLAEKVVIKITSDSSPSLIIPEGKEDYTYLVMPIKS